MQAATQLPTAPPLSGADLVTKVNAALQTLGTNFAGPDDPAAIAWAFSTWADTANMLLKRRNAANSAWVVEATLLRRHLPVYPEAEIPLTDMGDIHVTGLGPYRWNGEYYEPIGIHFSFVAPASGIAVEFTNIPSWAKRITVELFGASTNGTGPVAIQLGAGGIVSTGYVSQAATVQASGSGANYASNALLIEDSGGASFARYGTAVLTREEGNRWIMNSTIAVDLHTVARVSMAAGAVILPAIIDTVRVTNMSANIFDAGSIGILVEG